MRTWNIDRPALELAAAVLAVAGCSSHSAGETAAAPAPAATSADTARPTAAPADTTAGDSASGTAPSAGDTSAEAPSEMNPNPGGASSSAGASTGQADTGYVKYDAATKTVTFRLVAGPFKFNDYASGGATLTVPPGSNNVWNFEQADGTPHSAEIDSGEGSVPNSGGNPAIPRAYTNKVIEGLPQGATDVIKFTAPAQGTYRIICGVPGHAVGGMWIWFKIDPSAKTPTFAATPK